MNNLSNTTENHRVFLIGPMGAGKSTLGKRLARSLRLKYCDSDDELVAKTGASISLIFDVEGEDGFRAREAKLLEELTQRENLVLATGGGIILKEENRKILRERGYVVYLHAPLDRLLERTSKDSNRPLLQTKNPRARLSEILDERSSLYQQTADLSIDTDKLTIAQIIQKIKGELPWAN